MAASRRQSHDTVLEALEDLLHALENESPLDAIAARARQIRELRESGLRYRDIATDEFRPLVVEMIADYLARLSEASGRLRRAQAKALHDEGLTMEEIAERFGVSRQRVSQLLREVREHD